MATWAEIEAAEPDFARRLQARFDKYVHKVMATLRRDGSPRISGIEMEFRDGDVWLGMMPGSLKARDLQRDPRVALHSGTEDPKEGEGMAGVVVDAKLSGEAVEMDEAAPAEGDAPGAHVFRVDIDEAVLISIGKPADHLVIETWSEGRGLRSTKRY